jgi:predicted enzyme related to lactoylglutathione lyase
MPEVTAHSPGTPSWAELSTTDEAGALAFYGALFGWVDNPQQIGENWYYHMQKLNGLEAAAIYQQGEEEKNKGVPAHWNTYITAENVDAVAEKASQTGGKVLMGPMDVFDAGRMAMLTDPQGASFAVWQPKQHIGVRVKHDPGAMTWNELLTSDPDAAIEFYGGLLGLERGETMAPMNYTLIRAHGEEVAGVMQISPDMGPMPPMWNIYFAVANVDESAAKAQSLGGNVVVPPMDIPDIGRFAYLSDPQGGFFSIFKGA